LGPTPKVWNSIGFGVKTLRDVELITPIDDFRNLTDKVLEEVERLDGLQPDDLITVVIPEFVTSIRSQWLHNQYGTCDQGTPAVPPQHRRDISYQSSFRNCGEA